MNSSHLTDKCTVIVNGREVHLRVRQGDTANIWVWQVLSQGGTVINYGSVRSKVSAKVAAQLAIESRLRSVGSPVPTDYRWSEVVEP